MKSKKGQAALEFLTTYGWAFLVILVMIGALAYFGVLNPKKFIPPSCTIAAPFLCEDHLIQTDTVTLKIRNGNEPVTVNAVYLTNQDQGENVTVNTFSLCTSNVCSAGEVSDLTLDISPTTALTIGNKQKLLVSIVYYKTSSGSAYTKIAEGELIGTIQ
ncbi:MAG: hypothetical protein ABH828_02395 [archaeon]